MSAESRADTAMIGSPPVANPTMIGKVFQTPTAAVTSGLVDVQAKSATVQPTHLLWGVDSCKAFTGDPTGQELYPAVAGALGAPGFWGRYLTNPVCPGIRAAETSLAAQHHLAILPIASGYDGS